MFLVRGGVIFGKHVVPGQLALQASGMRRNENPTFAALDATETDLTSKSTG